MKRVAFEVMLVSVLVLLGLAARVAPHPANFTPIAAIAMLAGYAIRNRVLALSAPILALIAGDLVVGFYKPEIMVVVYAALSVPILFRGLLEKKFTPGRIIGCALASSLIFFATTNAAMWAFGSLYPKTAQGLLASYSAGVPFLRMNVLGDLVWSLGLLGAYSACAYAYRRMVPTSVATTKVC